MFDLRHLEHSTIIYEDPQHQPLLRLAWNKQDPNYLATMAMDALEVGFCDVSVYFVHFHYMHWCICHAIYCETYPHTGFNRASHLADVRLILV